MTTLQPDLQVYLDRYHVLVASQDTSNKLIEDLIVYANSTGHDLRQENTTLQERLRDAQLDLEDATRSRRELQQQLTAANAKLSQYNMDNENLKSRNPYVMVLIDGDGTFFLDEYIKQGVEGGKKAAKALRSAIIDQCSDLDDDVEVLAKVCANLNGLAKTMTRHGVVDNHEELRNFMLGFTQAKASFDFIDVGHGKERADSKIKEAARFNLKNHNCKKILLGISHDAGYAPFLDEILRSDHITRRVCIIEGSPVVRELENTGAAILSFDHIFAKEKFVERKGSSASYLQANAPPFVTNGNHPGSQPPTPHQPLVPHTWAGVTSVAPPLTTPPPLVFPVAIKNGAAAANAAAAAASTIITPHPKIKWNPGPRGLDDTLVIQASVLAKIKQRTGNNKLCNNHYLRGPCAKMDECPFEHKYKATEEDIKAISFLTRLNPCVNGQDCEIECIYGHHCPSWGLDLTKCGGQRSDEGVCGAFGCRFAKDAHPPDTVIKHPKKYHDYSY